MTDPDSFYQISDLPEGYRDAIHVNIDIHLSWRDRLRVLFGAIIFVKAITYCENLPGRCYSESRILVNIPRKQKLELGTTLTDKAKTKP